MEIGIVGLPNVGKSTLFNALTSGHAASSNYPFTTIEPNVGVVAVIDPRLYRLKELFNPGKTTPATIKFVDIAGLVQGASSGAGLGNKFLAHIREVDAIVHVIRLFQDPDVVHTLGAVDPLRDIEVIETELILADLQTLDKQSLKLSGMARSGDKESQTKFACLERIQKSLNEGNPARSSGLSPQELKPFFLLSAKPALYLGNIGEGSQSENEKWTAELQKVAKERGAKWLTVTGKMESELAQIADEEERKTFREELGMKETGLEKLVREAYGLLDLVTFFTAGPTEVRAWTVKQGSTAQEAAGQIHSDIAQGFIKAEIYHFKEIDQWKEEKVLQEKGLKRSEGKEYTIQDGDICYFHFRD